MADPTSPYSFLNYLKQTGPLYPFYIRESFYPLRREFDDYCRWVAGRPRQRAARYVAVERDRSTHEDEAATSCTRHDRAPASETYAARAVARARHRLRRRTCRAPAATCRGPSRAQLDLPRRHAIACRTAADHGGGQRAERRRDLPRPAGRHRRARLRAGLGDAVAAVLPAGVHQAHPGDDLPGVRRLLPCAAAGTCGARWCARSAGLYKGISGDLVDEIFDLLYAQPARPGRCATQLLTNTEVTDVQPRRATARYRLELHHGETRRTLTSSTDGLVLATGYRHQVPAFLDPVATGSAGTATGGLDVAPRLRASTPRPRRVRPERRAAHPRLRRTRPRDGGLPQLVIICRPGSAARSTRSSSASRPRTSGCPRDQRRGGEGVITFRRLDPERRHPPPRLGDAATRAFWQMEGSSVADVRAAYQEIDSSPHHDAFLGRARRRAGVPRRALRPGSTPSRQALPRAAGRRRHALPGRTRPTPPGARLHPSGLPAP